MRLGQNNVFTAEGANLASATQAWTVTQPIIVNRFGFVAEGAVTASAGLVTLSVTPSPGGVPASKVSLSSETQNFATGDVAQRKALETDTQTAGSPQGGVEVAAGGSVLLSSGGYTGNGTLFVEYTPKPITPTSVAENGNDIFDYTPVPSP